MSGALEPGTSLARVRALLGDHRAVDVSEADSLRRIRELIDQASAPFSRSHFVPGHLTASAIVVDRERRSTLLIFHQKLGLWLQPGGHFDPGEDDPLITAQREVREETGLEACPPLSGPLLLDVDVHRIPARKSDPEHFHFDLRLLLEAERLPPRAGEGVLEARWFEPGELKAMRLDPGLQRALSKVVFADGSGAKQRVRPDIGRDCGNASL